jgi:hypothetical protein
MQGRNWAPLILLAAVGLGVVVGLMVQAAHPEDQSGKYFGLPLMATVAVGIFFLLVWQNGWYRRSRDHYVEQKVAAAVARPKPAGPNLSPLELRRAMTLDPSLIDADQVRAEARAQMSVGEHSMRTGQIMCGLIGVVMLPAILLQNVRLMVFGAVPIVLYAVYLSARVLMRGGGLDQAYAGADREFAPLGLRLTERPQIRFGTRLDLNSNAGARMTHEMEGPMVFEGSRHGRGVHVEIEDGTSVVHIAGPAPEFKARSRYGKLESDAGDEQIDRALASLPVSNRWTGVKVSGDSEGITIRRKTRSNESWVYDLWLAEELAGAMS